MSLATYRLSDDLARRRMLYPSTIISAPSVLLVDVPVPLRGDGLGLGRYYAMIMETSHEQAEAERLLNLPRPGPVAPDFFDHRPSALVSDNVLISRYEPPTTGWPWLIVCRWPDSYVSLVQDIPGCSMARGRYTTEMFTTADDAEAHSVLLLEQLAGNGELAVRMISAETPAPAGTA